MTGPRPQHSPFLELPYAGEQGSVGSPTMVCSLGTCTHRRLEYLGPSGQGWAAQSVHCSLFFHFTERAVAGPQASHGAVSAVAVTLATVTFRGYWVRIQGVCMVSTARHFDRLIHQLLEGTRFLDVGPGWILVH